MTFRISRFASLLGFCSLVAVFAAACGGGGGGGGDGGGDGGGGGGSGAKCSNVLGQQCGAGEYCNFTDATCGEAGNEGVCQAITVTPCVGPTFSQAAPVCACTGVTFDNDCWAGAAGQSIRAAGACP